MGQIFVNVAYEPMSCKDVILDPTMDMDLKHHHGELVKNDVAKCDQQNGADVSIGPFRSHFASASAVVSGN
ncbi:hypothetical protein KIN20_028851 [Parelaphostrongylus tenuis]|uniref:Uncharacterized protein n=1 Tax=Parelaphostrongylus tenuis TaxID=148309 RepID=A0AAD5R1U4_PARTN|nr:hypothetical protein KIN20_028851 [Parelaphostrongylus tenuis]